MCESKEAPASHVSDTKGRLECSEPNQCTEFMSVQVSVANPAIKEKVNPSSFTKWESGEIARGENWNLMTN